MPINKQHVVTVSLIQLSLIKNLQATTPVHHSIDADHTCEVSLARENQTHCERAMSLTQHIQSHSAAWYSKELSNRPTGLARGPQEAHHAFLASPCSMVTVLQRMKGC